jgi:transcriptional regulator with XRE-family HTH domain
MHELNAGQLIYFARSRMGLTQEQFAEKYSISRVSIVNYELGKQNPGSDLILKILEELNFINLESKNEFVEFVSNLYAVDECKREIDACTLKLKELLKNKKKKTRLTQYEKELEGLKQSSN